jgi:hypothetical protein
VSIEIRPARADRLARVDHQIEKELTQLERIDRHRGIGLLEPVVELDSGSRDHLELRALGAHELGDVELRATARSARMVAGAPRARSRAAPPPSEQVEHRRERFGKSASSDITSWV